jgi:hypothetical protein
MALTPDEREAAKKRIIEVQRMIFEIDIELNASPIPVDTAKILQRAALFKERRELAVKLAAG